MKAWLVLTLLGLVACVASVPGAGEIDPAPDPPDGPPVLVRGPRPEPPEAIDGWTLVVREEESLDVGVHTRYERSDGLLADVWVYPVRWPESLCRLDCLEAWVASEADDYADQFPLQLIEAGHYSAIELVSDDTLSAPGPGLTRGRHLVFRVRDSSDHAGRSELLLAGGHGYRVKVRLTDYEQLAEEETARDLFEAYATRIVWPYQCRLGTAPAHDGVRMEGIVDIPELRMAEIVDSLFSTGGYEMKSSDGVWTTAADFEWPEGTQAESWHGEASPGYQLLVLLESRQDSTVFSVQSTVVCEIDDSEVSDSGSVMSNLQIVTAIAFTSKLSEVLDGPW